MAKHHSVPEGKRELMDVHKSEVCAVCNRRVYSMERLMADRVVYHKSCFKCSVCQKTLNVGTYAAMNGIIYCKAHFKQLFKLKANHDKGVRRKWHSSKNAAPGPLTPEAVTEAVTLVTWDNLCICLRVPASKCDEIELHFLANDRQRVLVEWWLSTDPSPSWRRLIQRLDDSGDTASADKIRCNLEPVQDPTFSIHNVDTAVESVQDWDGLGYHLGVPHEKHGSREEMLQYFITTVPNASWEILAGGLYYQQEHAALEKVAKYFQPHPEATLTVANLCTALEEVEWSRLADYLDVPESIKGQIKETFSSITQRKKAMLEEWRTHHPAPSWMLVATALYCVYIHGYGKYHQVLQLVKKKYLQAESALPEQPVSSTDISPTPSASPRKESAAPALPEQPVSSTDISPTPSASPRKESAILQIEPESTPPSSASSVMDAGSSLNKLSLVEIEYSDLEFKEVVGSGGFGTVSKGRWISENKVVAIKTMIVLDEREVRILSSLDHPSIIHYYGTAAQNNVHYIVTEFAENGSIYDYIFKEHKQPPPSQILLWATQVAEGMVYLHQYDIIHRDLKSSNIVLTSTLIAKICDLGSARSLQHTAKQTTAVGTYAWMAPEMLRREKVSKLCDVYSYGVLLFEIATQQLPFSDVLPIMVPSMIIEGKRPTIPETCDSRLADLIKCCWQQDAKTRPTFTDILITLSTITN